MRVSALLFVVIGIEAAMLSPSYAFDPRYPDWPCAQPKVPEISVAAIWTGPSIADVGNSWQDDPKIADLVSRLAARRTPLDAAQKAIAEFLTGTATEKQEKAKKLFAGLFDTLGQERTQVLDGIERAAHKEKDLADKIKSDVATLHAMEDKPDQDQAKVTDYSNQVQWSTTIFDDRRKTIRYVCEVPGTIEQRLFALARAIQQNLD
jgi:hypothetical protein